MDVLFERLNNIRGTIVSAAVETIQVFHFSNRLKNFAVAVAEPHPWVDLWRSMGINVYNAPPRHDDPVMNTSQLLQLPETLTFLKSLPQPVHILMFKPDAAGQTFLNTHGFYMIGCDPGRARRLENKMRFPRIAARAGITVPENHTLRIPSRPGRNALPDTPPFICQFAKGFSGNRTFLVRTRGDWEVLIRRFPGRNVRISPYLRGDTWTANGCVMPDDTIVVSEPFLQETHMYLSGDDDRLPSRIGSRGNVWGETPMDILRGVTDAMHRLGHALHQMDYTGFFGADFLAPQSGQDTVHSDAALLGIEVNPRITASASILTPLEMRAGIIPITGCHLAAGLDIPCAFGPDGPNIEPLPRGGQWIIRSKSSEPHWIDRIQSGVYAMCIQDLNAVPEPQDRRAAASDDLSDGECLIWKPDRDTATRERGRLIYRGDSSMFYRFLEMLKSVTRIR